MPAVASSERSVAGVSADEYRPGNVGAIGYRFWSLADDGCLYAPIKLGAWVAGLNVAECAYSCEGDGVACWNSCGLYACTAREDASLCEPYRFDPPSATVDGYGPGGVGAYPSMAIFGSTVLFEIRSTPSAERMRAGHGFVAALALPPEPEERMRRAAERAAARYGVPILAPDGLAGEARALLARAERIPEHATLAESSVE